MARFLMSRTVLLVYGKTHLRNRGLEVRILPGVLIEKTLKATQNQGELSSWFLHARSRHSTSLLAVRINTFVKRKQLAFFRFSNKIEAEQW